MYRCEFLQRFHLPKSLHSPLSPPEWKVSIFSPVVEIAPHLTALDIAQCLHRSGVRAQSVGDNFIGLPMALQRLLHELRSRSFVPFLPDRALQNFALVIDGTSQIDHLVVELHVHLVKMPPPVTEALHSRFTLTANVSREHRTETISPEPHRFMAKVNRALEQQVFHVAQRQREPEATPPGGLCQAKTGNNETDWLVYGVWTCTHPTPQTVAQPTRWVCFNITVFRAAPQRPPWRIFR